MQMYFQNRSIMVIILFLIISIKVFIFLKNNAHVIKLIMKIKKIWKL